MRALCKEVENLTGGASFQLILSNIIPSRKLRLNGIFSLVIQISLFQRNQSANKKPIADENHELKNNFQIRLRTCDNSRKMSEKFAESIFKSLFLPKTFLPQCCLCLFCMYHFRGGSGPAARAVCHPSSIHWRSIFGISVFSDRKTSGINKVAAAAALALVKSQERCNAARRTEKKTNTHQCVKC
jgi:hypothetical protein